MTDYNIEPPRVNPDTFRLSLAASRVLDVLRCMLAPGASDHISQADIAEIGNLSEGSVSRVMPELIANGFIVRTYDQRIGGGRGGYVITLLPNPRLHNEVQR